MRVKVDLEVRYEEGTVEAVMDDGKIVGIYNAIHKVVVMSLFSIPNEDFVKLAAKAWEERTLH